MVATLLNTIAVAFFCFGVRKYTHIYELSLVKCTGQKRRVKSLALINKISPYCRTYRSQQSNKIINFLYNLRYLLPDIFLFSLGYHSVILFIHFSLLFLNACPVHLNFSCLYSVLTSLNFATLFYGFDTYPQISTKRHHDDSFILYTAIHQGHLSRFL